MSYPFSVQVTFDFSSGPTFGYPLVLDDPLFGILGTNILADNASDIVDISSTVTNISIKGGYNLLTDQFEASTATVRVYDPTGLWNPQNTASPYFGKIIPNRKVRISTLYLGVSRYLFSGYASSYNYSYPKDENVGYVDILCTDAFRLFQLVTVSSIPLGIAGQSTGQRINTILDVIGWPSSLRSIDNGDSYCQADPGGTRTALGAIKVVEATEQGAFYITGEGNAIFKSRSAVEATNGAAPITVFNNNGTDIGYFNLTFAHDDKLVINSTTITNVGGTAQTSSDAESQEKYFKHSYAMPNLLGQTDADALNIAQLYTATRKDTTIRIDSMTLDLSTPDYSAGVTAGLSLDYFNTVRITSETQGTTSITKTLQVMGAAYEITPAKFFSTFTTSEPIDEAFILDSELYGILDQSMITY
jgi:hypothetical protein